MVGLDGVVKMWFKMALIGLLWLKLRLTEARTELKWAKSELKWAKFGLRWTE